MVSVDAQKAAKDTKTDHELGFCHDPALPKEWGPRNTRKDAKGDEKCGLGGPCHIVRPTLDKGRAPARSGVACPKNVQRQYLTCPSELVPPSLSVLRGFLCIFFLLPSVRAWQRGASPTFAAAPTPARPIEHLRRPRAAVDTCEIGSPGIPPDPQAGVRRSSSNALRLPSWPGSARSHRF